MTLKLKFKIQQYQTDAVKNVVKVFNGQPNKGLAEYVVDKGKTYIKDNGKLTEVKTIHFEEDSTGYKNGDIVLTKDELLKNIHQVQTENNIRLSNDVVDKLGHCQLVACAEKLFEQLSTYEVKYGKIDSYDTLMSLVK